MHRPTIIQDDEPLPPTAWALGPASDAPGLLAVGGRVSPTRLAEAYTRGIFPWYAPGQAVCWWSPDPRMVLAVSQFKLMRSLRKTLKRFLRTAGCEFRFDSDLPGVMRACANTPRHGLHGTWIVPAMMDAYTAWHREGAVHSVETWVDGAMVGGLYGVNLGRMVFGESMFSTQTDASKLALCALVAFCRAQNISHIDCQQNTSHLASLGAQEMPREAFEAHLARTVSLAPPTRWAYDPAHWDHLDPSLLDSL
jgi:leucyl/phenylalanyl-tRNA---protein transferase